MGNNLIHFTTIVAMQTKAFIDVAFTAGGTVMTSRYASPFGGAEDSADFVLIAAGEPRTMAFPFVSRRRLRARYRTPDGGPGRIIEYTELPP